MTFASYVWKYFVQYGSSRLKRWSVI